MHKIHPVIAIGIGPQAQQTIRGYVECVRIRQGHIPALLPVVLGFVPSDAPFRRESDTIQHLTLSSPMFVGEEWPNWFPSEFADLPIGEKKQTRAWLRAAMLQQADELQEFLLESIPHLSSFAAVEEMNQAGVTLAGDSEIRVYVIADLSDQLGSSIFVDIAYLTYYVCRQLGLHPTTTGLLFLPSATSPAPAEEAMAYAALKELEHYFETNRYNGEFAPDWALAEEIPPFQDGCYLLDNVNELGYTLEDADQQTSAVSEWLCAMSLLDMQDSIREQQDRRYLRATLRGKSRAYESFGLTIRYIPQVPLMDWLTARLGSTAIERMLNAPINGDPQRDADAFIARTGLGVDTVTVRLHQQVMQQSVESALAPLGATPLGQIEAQARQALQVIRERRLPVMDRELTEASQSIQHEMHRAIYDEVRAILKDRVLGGIAAAQRFLELLREQVSGLQEEAEDLAKRHRAELKQSLSTISRTHYTLRSVMMSIPPWPITALSAVFLLVLPVIYVLQVISQVIRPLDETWASASLGILGVGILGVMGFVAQRVIRQRRLVADQHKGMIRERFELESKPLFTRAIRAVYGATHEAIDQAERDVEPLVSELNAVSSHFELRAKQNAYQLRQLARPGPFRSSAGDEQIQQLFATISTEVDRFIEASIHEIGSLADWYARGSDSDAPLSASLSNELSDAASKYLEHHLDRLNVLDIMTQNTSAADLQQNLQRMFESARPLWNYDPRILRRAKTQRMTLVGADTESPGWAKMVGPLSRVRPDTIAFDTRDPFTMVVLCVHRGLPLFALRRMNEYRAHYAEMIWHSRLPLHTTHEFSLAEDLVPVQRRLRKLSVPTLFAVGLALGSIGRDASGRHLAPRPRDQSIRLSTQKERSVALLSMDAPACRELERQFGILLKAKGRRAVSTILDEYMTVMPNLADWEVQGIVQFSRAFRLDQENH